MDTAKGKIENQVKVQVETLDVLDLDLPTTEYQHNIMISLFYTMYFLYFIRIIDNDHHEQSFDLDWHLTFVQNYIKYMYIYAIFDDIFYESSEASICATVSTVRSICSGVCK